MCFSAIHAKSIVAILHLLVALSQHFRAPIRLPDHVSIQVVVVQVLSWLFLYDLIKVLQHLDTFKSPMEIYFSFIFPLFTHVFVFSQKREGILQSQQVLEEITGNTEYVITVRFFFFFLSLPGHSCASETGSADIFQKDKLDSPEGKK